MCRHDAKLTVPAATDDLVEQFRGGCKAVRIGLGDAKLVLGFPAAGAVGIGGSPLLDGSGRSAVLIREARESKLKLGASTTDSCLS